MKNIIQACKLLCLGFSLIVIPLLTYVAGETATPVEGSQLGYGFNVATLETDSLQAMGFDWIKLFGAPGERLPFNVLLRIDATSATLVDLDGFEQSMAALAATHGDRIEAYEIGNESNLDASWGWTTAPNAADYVDVLCAAYRGIHSADSDAVVVSAGLAPTGRVSGNWNGHEGHNGFYQDERLWLKEFIFAGGAACVDAVGYHPYGYRANFDAEPDVTTNDVSTSCPNGFCFRSIEKFREVLTTYGVSDKPIWATEYGWIVQPPNNCLSDPTWAGRQWQIVDEATQAANLAGSFAYAVEHWPWAGPMFIFNHNFNDAPWYQSCEQMRFYAVAGRSAETALQAIPKQYAVSASPSSFTWMIEADEQPTTLIGELNVLNGGLNSAEINLAAIPETLSPTLNLTNATIPKRSQHSATVTVVSTTHPVGTFNATVELSSDRYPTTSIPVTLIVVNELHQVFVPIVLR